ncbi:hypothetical protein Verru16b_02995 [Lacunisphaera limnophila]|uniref:Uncharacterized protein n=1 Tax=Lacunisphaera limnophila TaxID=1838286 RepID=A0A1D8AYG3_9BACT|nr:hypothetical protein Verru16b_02995 [Lacunisphaera limnophila]
MTTAFQARYCARWGVSPADFRADLLTRTLYLPARPLVRLLAWFDSEYFQADYEFIDDVVQLADTAGFRDALDCYAQHFSNRRFLRSRLRLRISARRMWRVVHEIVPSGPSGGAKDGRMDHGSLTPFGD